jgi:plasmid maintenance system antidote protein VapI
MTIMQITNPHAGEILRYEFLEELNIEPIWYLKKQLTYVIKVGESKDGFW